MLLGKIKKTYSSKHKSLQGFQAFLEKETSQMIWKHFVYSRFFSTQFEFLPKEWWNGVICMIECDDANFDK